ncbi:MAG: hypothetical protein ACYDHE_01850 [Candidatus Acidiferrales bacterium]
MPEAKRGSEQTCGLKVATTIWGVMGSVKYTEETTGIAGVAVRGMFTGCGKSGKGLGDGGSGGGKEQGWREVVEEGDGWVWRGEHGAG